VRNFLVGYFLVVHLQHTSATLGNAGSIISEVEHQGVLARRKRIRTFPTESLQIEEVVGEYRLALEQVNPYPPNRPPNVTSIPLAAPSGTSTSAAMVAGVGFCSTEQMSEGEEVKRTAAT
jgi:hypothetical protein